jgi:malate dehydrogenase (oxaloacetate-decarboxylating)(NADP+)
LWYNLSSGFSILFSSNRFIGPITNGFEKPVQILQATATANEILKIATFACIEAIKEV